MDWLTAGFRRPLRSDWLFWWLLLLPVASWRIGKYELNDAGSWFGGRPQVATRVLVVAVFLFGALLILAWARRLFVARVERLVAGPAHDF